MKLVATTRHIEAPPDAVWAVLTDEQALVNGGTGITRIEGSITPHGVFRLYAEVAGDRAFNIKVTAFEPPKRLVWRSGFWPAFVGTRVFTLRPVGGGTELSMEERFTGLALPLIWRSMPDLQPGFEQFTAAVAALAEGHER